MIYGVVETRCIASKTMQAEQCMLGDAMHRVSTTFSD